MATRTISVAGGSWNTTGAWLEGAVPTAADDVVATVLSGNLVVTATSVCRSLNLTGYTGTVSGSGDLSIGDGSGGACTLAGTLTGTWTVTFKSTSNNGGTGWGITSNGKAFPGDVTFNGAGGKWVCQDAFSCGTNAITVTSGGFFGNGMTITCASFVSTGSTTRTVDLTNCSVSLSGGGTAWNISSATNLTFTATGSTLTFTGASATLNSLAVTVAYGSIVFNGSGAASFASTNATSVVNLTRVGTAVKTDSFVLNNNLTIAGTLTLGGNTTQGVNRLLVSSNTVGTQRTITMTGAAVVINGDVDFQDMLLSGSPSWTNTGSAFIGDALGNGPTITANRTTPATQTSTGTASFTWSTHSWTSRVPLPQDNVSIPNAFSATMVITADMPRLGADITFTCTGNPTWTNTVAQSMYGSLTMASGMLTSGTITLTMAGRGAQTLTSNGVTFTQGLIVSAPGGSYTLQDALTDSRPPGVTINVLAGTFIDNGMIVTLSSASSTFQMTSPGAATLTGTWNIAATAAAAFWNVTAASTLTASAMTIVLTAASANTRTFAGGGKSYGTLTYSVAGSTGALVITGANTFGTINFSDASNARTLTLLSATTTTVTTFNVFGTSGKLMTVNSSTAGTAATLSKASGQVECRFLSLQDSTATGGASFYAPQSTNVSNNTGWNFGQIAPPILADTLAATDAVTHVESLGVAPADSLGMTGTTTPALAFNTTVADLLGITDTASPVETITLSLSDLLGIIDAATPAETFAVSPGDALGIIDTASPVSSLIVQAADLLGLDDDMTQELDVNVADLLGIIDAIRLGSGIVQPTGISVAKSIQALVLAASRTRVRIIR